MQSAPAARSKPDRIRTNLDPTGCSNYSAANRGLSDTLPAEAGYGNTGFPISQPESAARSKSEILANTRWRASS